MQYLRHILMGLILMIAMINKANAFDTELFACPTAETLKKGEWIVGYRFFDKIYLKVGLEQVELGGLVSLGAIYGSLKFICLKERKNFPQVTVFICRGRSVEWYFEHSYKIDSYGLIFSKNLTPNWQINVSINKGKNPPIWDSDTGAHYNTAKFSLHTSLEKKINNLKIVGEFHNFSKEKIMIGGIVYKTNFLNFKLGHGFLKEKKEIEHIYPFLNIEFKKEK